MDFVALIAEEKIREAIRNGELENLPGKGRPLRLENLSLVPEELRAGYIILKNAGILPQEIELKKEIVSLRDLVNCCYEDGEINLLKRKLNEKLLRFNILMEKRNRNSPALKYYQDKIYNKLSNA